MTPTAAAQLLSLPAEATPDQIEARFLELRAKLEDKIAKAPTPGLKAKYRDSLEQITEAFETLTLAADSSALPVVQKSKVEGPGSKVESQTNPRDSNSSTVDPRPSPVAPRKSGGSKEFVIVALIAVILLAGGGWFMMKMRAENAEKARLAEIAQAEAAQAAAEQARDKAAAAAAAENLRAARQLADQAARALQDGNTVAAAEYTRAAFDYVPNLPEARVVQNQLDRLNAAARTESLLTQLDQARKSNRWSDAVAAGLALQDHAPTDNRTPAALRSLSSDLIAAIESAITERDSSRANEVLSQLEQLAARAPTLVPTRSRLTAAIAALPDRLVVPPNTNLNSIINAAAAGTIIELSEGEYEMYAVNRQQPLEILGRGNPDRIVIIQRQEIANKPMLWIGGARVRLANLTLRQEGEVATESRPAVLHVYQQGELEMENVRVRDAVGTGIYLVQKSKIIASRLTVTGAAWNGLLISDGSKGSVTDSMFNQNGNGLGMGEDATGEFLRCQFNENSSNGGVYVEVAGSQNASLQLVECSAKSNRAHGFYFRGEGHTIVMRDCVAQDNGIDGFTFGWKPASVRVDRCTAENNTGGTGFNFDVQNSLQVTASQLRSRGNGQGISFIGALGTYTARLTLRDSVMENNRTNGVWVQSALFSESGNTVRGNPENNYMVSDRSRR